MLLKFITSEPIYLFIFILRLVYTSIQVAANQSLGKSRVTGDLRLPVQLRSREIHSRSNNYHFLQICACIYNYFILIFVILDFFELTSFFQHQSSYIISSTCIRCFQFRRSTHNILTNYLKFYPTCLKINNIIFPKFLEIFHKVGGRESMRSMFRCVVIFCVITTTRASYHRFVINFVFAILVCEKQL